MAGHHARHAGVFGIPSWPPARVTGVASWWGDGLARTKQRQAWLWGWSVSLPLEVQRGWGTPLGVSAHGTCPGKRRLHGAQLDPQTTLNLTG